MKKALVIGFVIAVMVPLSAASAQTAADFWNLNMRFEEIRAEMQVLIDSGEGVVYIQQQQIILSGADIFRARTRAAMVYLQMLSYVTDPANMRSARADLASVFDEELPTIRRLATSFAAMGKKPYGIRTQGLAVKMGEAVSSTAQLEERLAARLKNVAVRYDWIGQ